MPRGAGGSGWGEGAWKEFAGIAGSGGEGPSRLQSREGRAGAGRGREGTGGPLGAPRQDAAVLAIRCTAPKL